MARGYPDYFGYSVFPYYGDLLNQDQLIDDILIGDTETVFELNHKGVIMGGELVLQSTDSPPVEWIIITIDGSEILNKLTSDFYRLNLTEQGNSIISLSTYNIDEFYRCYLFARQTTFSTHFLIQVTAGPTSNIHIHGYLNYTAIRT